MQIRQKSGQSHSFFRKLAQSWKEDPAQNLIVVVIIYLTFEEFRDVDII
jgi:hypothetical protein